MIKEERVRHVCAGKAAGIKNKSHKENNNKNTAVTGKL